MIILCPVFLPGFFYACWEDIYTKCFFQGGGEPNEKESNDEHIAVQRHDHDADAARSCRRRGRFKAL